VGRWLVLDQIFSISSRYTSIWLTVLTVTAILPGAAARAAAMQLVLPLPVGASIIKTP